MPTYNRNANLAREMKCAKCGKTFIMRCSIDEYGWKLYTNKKRWWFCSYSCMRAVEAPKVIKARKKVAKEIAGMTKKAEKWEAEGLLSGQI